jgi:hypothetical protein
MRPDVRWFSRRKIDAYTASVMSRQLPVYLAARLAEESVPDFARKHVAEIEQALNQIQTMPNRTISDRVARAATLQHILESFR